MNRMRLHCRVCLLRSAFRCFAMLRSSLACLLASADYATPCVWHLRMSDSVQWLDINVQEDKEKVVRAYILKKEILLALY